MFDSTQLFFLVVLLRAAYSLKGFKTFFPCCIEPKKSCLVRGLAITETKMNGKHRPKRFLLKK